MSIAATAVTKINARFKVPDNRTFVLYLKEVLPSTEMRKPIQQELNVGVKRSITINLDIKNAGFFTLSVVSTRGENKSAYNNVIYLKPNAKINLDFQAGEPLWLTANYQKTNDADNRALLAINEKFNDISRELFNSKDDLSVQKTIIGQLHTVTNAALADKRISPDVQKYLKFNAFDVYSTRLYALGMEINKRVKNNLPVPADFYTQPVDPLAYFNDPMILLFPYGDSNVIRYLEVNAGMPVHKNRKSIEEIAQLIDLLKSKIAYPAMRDQVIGSLLNGYTTNYRVGGNFDADLQTYLLKAEQINDPKTRAAVKMKFENLRYTMKGASIPNLKFENAAGTFLSLEQFKGKYLFIDLWASWCVPCIKMMPFVQQLEKQYEGKNINFVAISIDANKANWLKKMKELNLHGSQFLDQSGSFANALNVSGIPHYLIYDPEGKLLVYKADTPDNPNLKVLLDQLLNLK